MGTRNLTAVMIDGKYKIAQYGQWDGYPSGQGLDALNFLRKMDEEKFKRKLRATKFITDTEYSKKWKTVLGEDVGEFVSIEDSKKFHENYPQLSRDHGAKILSIVHAGHTGLELLNKITFANDSLFCEWAYIIDFDKRTFEVYKGFNEKPLEEDERFYNEECNKLKYKPIKFNFHWSLDELPTDEEFLNTLEPNEEEDE